MFNRNELPTHAYFVLLRKGFTFTPALLPELVRSYRTVSPLLNLTEAKSSCLFSVALSGNHGMAVAALDRFTSPGFLFVWSPDFPLMSCPTSDCPFALEIISNNR